MKDYKHILFDLDGTITDPKIGITKSVNFALNFFGITVPNLDDLCKFIGPPLINSFMEFYNFDEINANLAVEKYREYYSKSGIFENLVYDGIPTLLDKLQKNGKKIYLATSKPTVYAIQILKYFDLFKYFDFVSGSNLDNTMTDKSEVIKYVLTKSNILDLSSAIMIGDRKHDIIGAKKANIDSIGVLYGYGNLSELKDAKATFIVDTITSLSNFLI